MSRVAIPATVIAAVGSLVTLQVSSSTAKVEIVRVKLKRTLGAAAATFTPRIYSLSTAAAADIEQEYEGAASAAANLFDATGIQALCYTDALGRLYFQPNPNVAGDSVKIVVYMKVWD